MKIDQILNDDEALPLHPLAPIKARPVIVTDAAAGTEPGRMTTAEILTAMAQLGTQLKVACENYQKLPDLTPQQVDGVLSNIIAAAKGVQLKAEKLQAANK